MRKEVEVQASAQKKIPEFTPMAGAIQVLFPELTPQEQRRIVSWLDHLSPNPLERENLLVLRTREGKTLKGTVVGNKKDSLASIFEASFADFGQREEIKKCKGAVVWLSANTFLEAETLTENLIPLLPAGGGLWFLEKMKVKGEDKKIREDTMESLGLVNRKVVQKGEICLSYGRKEKGRQPQEIDLTVKPYFQRILEKTRKEILAAGWRNVSLDEVIGKCQKSKFPARDLENLKLGFGVAITAPCGCQWQVTLDGEWKRLWQCSEECEGQPKDLRREREIFWVGEDIPPVKAIGRKLNCNDCGKELLFDRRVIGRKNGATLINSDLKCPSCGLVSKMIIKTEKVVKEFKEE